MAFFARCISGNSLKGMVRGEAEEDELGGSGSTTPNDTAHGGSKFSSYSWKRLSAKSRSSLNSPKKQYTPPLSATSVDGTGPPRPSMEPVMERTRSALTDLEAVKFLVEDWSHKHWRPATPQDQQRFDRLEHSDIKPLVALGEGAYGSVNLCRIAANLPGSMTTGSQSGAAVATPFSAAGSQSLREASSGAAGCSGTGGDTAARDGAVGACRSLSASRQQTASSGLGQATSNGLDGTGGEGSIAEPAGAPSDRDGGGGSVPNAEALRAADGEAVEDDPSVQGVCSAAPAESGAEGWMHPASSMNDPQLIVAVKRVPLGWNQERELMQLHRCQQCPFIVRLFGFVDDGSEHCSYVMEWAEGGDLGVMLASLKDRRGENKQRPLMSEASARYYMGCLLLALEFLHANGLLHRDIKPSNLLLTSDGTAKLADLGFTVALDSNGQTVGCCGTTGYIAPEVYSYGTTKGSMAYGVPADIWSAGATLYQVLTGNVVTDTPDEMLKKGWRSPTHPRFSHPLQDLLNRMLAVKPTARPQSAMSVMRHSWFTGFDWSMLREGRMKAPYVPSERRRMRQVAEDVMSATQPLAGEAASASGSGGGGGPPIANPGGQRLSTVMERVSSLQSCMDGDKVVQRSALSGRGEGSVKHGLEGLVRDGLSFETALGTVTTAEVRAVADGAAAATEAAAAGTPATSPPPRGERGHAAEPHGHVPHGHVRFKLGVAECA